MKRCYGAVGLGLIGCSVSIVAVQAQSTVAWQDGTLAHGNLNRHFRYYAPANLPANAPVVVLFHGGSQSMRKLFEERAGGNRRNRSRTMTKLLSVKKKVTQSIKRTMPQSGVNVVLLYST